MDLRPKSFVSRFENKSAKRGYNWGPLSVPKTPSGQGGIMRSIIFFLLLLLLNVIVAVAGDIGNSGATLLSDSTNSGTVTVNDGTIRWCHKHSRLECRIAHHPVDQAGRHKRPDDRNCPAERKGLPPFPKK